MLHGLESIPFIALTGALAVFLLVTGIAHGRATRPSPLGTGGFEEDDPARAVNPLAWTPATGVPLTLRIGAIITQRLQPHSSLVAHLVSTETSRSAKLDRLLNQAGRPWGMTGVQLDSLSVLGGVGIGAVATYVAVAVAPGWWYVGALLGVVALVLPRLVVRRMAAERVAEIKRGVPGLLDLLVLNAEAGGTPRSGFTLAAQKLSGPLGQEVAAVERQVSVGLDEEMALLELAQRTAVPELEELAMNVRTATRFGAVQYADALGAQATRVRTALVQEVQKDIHALSVKLLFPIVVFYLPAMFLVFLGPSMLDFVHAI
ncbi:MAG: hypothetical protein M0010_13915 [Actinomycetota bacterium]|nr:hypothetical protein [Actinomycetota bacterium]